MQLNHQRTGSGDPLVLIHGIGSQWQMWEPLFERLAPRRELIAIDLPGFGDSPPLPAGERATPQRLAEAVASFLDELGLERPAIAGNSLGGWVALELARHGRARAVAANSPAGFWTRREQAWCIHTLRLNRAVAASAGPGLRSLLRNPIGRTLMFQVFIGKPWRVPPDAAIGALENLGESPGWDSALEELARHTFAAGQEISVPVTVIWGNRDLLLIPRQGDRAARVIPGARLVRLPGAGHVPTWDEPERMAQLLAGL